MTGAPYGLVKSTAFDGQRPGHSTFGLRDDRLHRRVPAQRGDRPALAADGRLIERHDNDRAS